ncbi:MAG: formyl transferase [Alphaproteobacteria bacterium]|nr:formyl transferase [Alphaproteobacteria bacterium]
MRIVLIGAVQFSLSCLETLIAQHANLVGIVTRKSIDAHADFADLEPLAEEHTIPVLKSDQINNPDVLAWIKTCQPDVIFCFGWSQIIKSELLAIPPLGIVGYHPALLPENRGRHPIIWALVLGLKETGSTFFFMDQSPDSGPILSQKRLSIGEIEDAGSLYARLTEVAQEQIIKFLPQIEMGSAPRLAQPSEGASSWRKRTPIDGRIDWRMSSQNIHNLVRALTPPYPGATISVQGREYPIWRTSIGDTNPSARIEPGFILSVDGQEIEVKTGDGSIVLMDHDVDPLPHQGDYF